MKFLFLSSSLLHSDPESNGGGGAILKQIGDKVGDIAKTNETLLKNYDQLSKDTKSAMEEFTKAKNRLDSIEDITRSLQKLNMQLSHERRMAFGDPVQRIAADPEKRTLLVAMIARSLGGEVLDACGKRVKEVAKQLSLVDGIAQRDLDSANTPGSTFLDTNQVETDLYDVLASFGAYRTLDVRRVSAKATEIRLRTARAAMTFIDEAAQIGADSTKAGSRVTVTPKKIAGLINVSRELLDDDAVGAVNELLAEFGESAAYRLDWAAFSADGGSDSTDGGFTGMLGGGGTDVTAASGNTTVATTDFEDWVAVVANSPAGILSRPCRWWMHPTILVKALYIKDSNGRPIFNTAIEAPSSGSIGSILGFPTTMVPAAPSTDSAGARVAAFGDPFGVGVRIRRDMAFDRSEHFAFDTDEISFRATMRAAIKVKIATSIQVLKTAAS
jgi:HK97 family phage major capsid protein